jgi:hypothetical protein
MRRQRLGELRHTQLIVREVVNILNRSHRCPFEAGAVCARALNHLNLTSCEQIHAERVRPDLRYVVMAEHLGGKILYIVRNDERRLAFHRHGHDMGVLSLRRRLAHTLDGRHKGRRYRDARGRKSPFHLAAPVLDPVGRNPHAGIEICHPLRVDRLGPNRLERSRFSEMQKKIGQLTLKQDARIEDGDGYSLGFYRFQKSYSSLSAARLSNACRCCRDSLL